MPTAASQLAPTQYGDLVFPGTVQELQFVGRHHVHEYSHVPGGAVEKLGRGLVHVTIRTSFEDRFKAPYQNLYPAGLNKLRGYAFLQATLPLVHPSAGSFPATIINYTQKKDAKLLSGERVDLEFLEDQAASFALSAQTSDVNSSVGVAAQNLSTVAQLTKSQLQFTPNDLSLLDAIQNTADAVLGYRDTAMLIGNRYVAAVGKLLGLCQQLDQSISMQDVRAWPVVDALRQLQGQAVQIVKDSQSQRIPLRTYVVPQTTSLLQIALTLYQDASRQGDLLELNAAIVPTPMTVKAGTPLVYYPPTASQQASLNAA
jgi:hypothetical protein